MRGSSEAVVQRIERELVERGNEAEVDKTKAVHTPIVQLLKGLLREVWVDTEHSSGNRCFSKFDSDCNLPPVSTLLQTFRTISIDKFAKLMRKPSKKV